MRYFAVQDCLAPKDALAPVPLADVGPWTAVNAARHEYLPVRTNGRLITDKTLLAQAGEALGQWGQVQELTRDQGIGRAELLGVEGLGHLVGLHQASPRRSLWA